MSTVPGKDSLRDAGLARAQPVEKDEEDRPILPEIAIDPGDMVEVEPDDTGSDEPEDYQPPDPMPGEKLAAEGDIIDQAVVVRPREDPEEYL